MNTRTVITTSQRLAPGVAIALLLFAATGLRAADFEKGATRLMRMGRPEPVPEKSDFKPMSCQKCKDVVTQVPDWSAKGGQILMAGGRPTKPVVRHQCEGCVHA